jgi:hypothetical protein
MTALRGGFAAPLAPSSRLWRLAGCHAFAPLRKHAQRQAGNMLSQAKAWHPAMALATLKLR